MHADREGTGGSLVKGLLLAATAAAALMNATRFSPIFDSVLYLIRPFVPGVLASSPTAMFYFTGLLIAVTTLLLGGVPAALYERARGLRHSSLASLIIWFVFTVILALPTLAAAAGAG